MKIIDLLNKIANGIDIPLQIKYDNNIWKYDEMARDYLLIDKSGEEYLICEELNLMYALNDEVEIIGEDKKIEKYNTGLDNGKWNEESVRKTILEDKNIDDFLVRLMKETDAIKFKLYEIIDKINED